MSNQTHVDLLKRYNQGVASEEEIAVVESWFLEFPLDDRPVLNQNDAVADLEQIKTELLEMTGHTQKRSRLYWLPAAALILIISAISLFLSKQHASIQSRADLVVSNIHPGKSAATLTLADGRKIVLKENLSGKLASQSGVLINKSTDGQIIYKANTGSPAKGPLGIVFNILSTAKGEQYQIILPDGTKVWLNAASSLKFTPSFAGLATRNVELSGEAYFEVAKDQLHPFEVKTRGQYIKVLGTHFNVNAYTDEPYIKTTLLEGSVNVNDKVILRPGQESQFSNTGLINIYPADTEAATAWKTGEFIFRDATLPVIMRQIARWYNLDIVYQGEPNNETYNGAIAKKADLSRILKILERGGVKFKVQNRQLLVTP